MPVGVIVIGEGISVKQFEVEMFVLDKVPFCSFERRNDYIISIGINTVDKINGRRIANNQNHIKIYYFRFIYVNIIKNDSNVITKPWR